VASAEVAYLGRRGEIVELAPEEAERVLRRDSELAREWQSWSAKAAAGGGRLVVLDGDRVRSLIAREGDGGTA
jgi:hypothetical protein